MTITPEQLAYIAGLFDGEGSVSFMWVKSDNGKRYGRLQARISQNDRTVLDWTRALMGFGSIHARDRRHTEPNRAISHDYIVTARNAREFLRRIRPYLIVKAVAVDTKVGLDAAHCRPQISREQLDGRALA